jgi:hypothetical protein
MHLLRNLGKWQDLRGRNVTFDRQVIYCFIPTLLVQNLCGSVADP